MADQYYSDYGGDDDKCGFQSNDKPNRLTKFQNTSFWREPEIYDKTRLFDITQASKSSRILSRDLADENRRLINILEDRRSLNFRQYDDSILNTYQLELRQDKQINNGSFLFYLLLRVKLEEWIYMFEKYSKNYEKLLKAYVERIRSECEHQDDDFELNDPCHNVVQTINICDMQINMIDGTQQPCGFFAFDGYSIHEKHAFRAAVRCNGHPVITVYPVYHVNNTEWVTEPDSWQAVIDTLIYSQHELHMNTLPLRRIYVNFNKWHSQSKDINRPINTGHAHMNIVYPREAINKCKEINNQFRCLKNATIRPPNYRWNDPVNFLQNIYADFKASDSISENDDDNIDNWGATKPHQPKLLIKSGSNKRRDKVRTTSDEIRTRVHRQRHRTDSESSSENLNKIFLTN